MSASRGDFPRVPDLVDRVERHADCFAHGARSAEHLRHALSFTVCGGESGEFLECVGNTDWLPEFLMDRWRRRSRNGTLRPSALPQAAAASGQHQNSVFRLHDDGRTKRVLTIPWSDKPDARLDDLVENPSGELWVTGSFYDDSSEASHAIIARYRCR